MIFSLTRTLGSLGRGDRARRSRNSDATRAGFWYAEIPAVRAQAPGFICPDPHSRPGQSGQRPLSRRDRNFGKVASLSSLPGQDFEGGIISQAPLRRAHASDGEVTARTSGHRALLDPPAQVTHLGLLHLPIFRSHALIEFLHYADEGDIFLPEGGIISLLLDQDR